LGGHTCVPPNRGERSTRMLPDDNIAYLVYGVKLVEVHVAVGALFKSIGQVQFSPHTRQLPGRHNTHRHLAIVLKCAYSKFLHLLI